MKKILPLILILYFNFSFGQIKFQKTYHSGACGNSSVIQASDGGYVVSTSGSISGSSDLHLMKINSYGDTLWTRTVRPLYDGLDCGYSVRQTFDGGYIATGKADVGTSDEVYLIKFTAAGDTSWVKSFGGTLTDHGYSVKQTSDSGYIVVGTTYSFGQGGSTDAYLIKTNKNGNLTWSKRYGGIQSETGNDVLQTSDGGYIVAGSTNTYGNFGLHSAMFVVKTDASGDTLWAKSYGGANGEAAESISQTNDGGYIVGGSTSGITPGDDDLYMVRINSTGDTLWTRDYASTGNGHDDYCNSVQQTFDGGFILAGSKGTSFMDGLLIKTNANGDTMWTKAFPGGEFYSVQQTPDSGYIALGTTTVGCYLVKTDRNGSSGCNEYNPAILVRTPAITVLRVSTAYSATATLTSATTTLINRKSVMTTICTSIGIDEISSESEIRIFPNPANSILTISLSRQILNTPHQISICDVTGREFYRDKIRTSKLQLSISGIPPGLYFVKVGDAVQKLIIQ